MRLWLTAILLFSFVLNTSGFAFSGNYILKGSENSPAVISIDKIQNISGEVTTIRPYRTSTEGIREELLLYRGLYIIFALFQGYVLIKAAARQ